MFAAVKNGEDVGALFDPAARRFETLIGLGITLLYGILWVRIHLAGEGSSLPSGSPNWERWLSRAAHWGIYLTITGALASGFAMAWLVSTDVVVDLAAREVLRATARFSAARTLHEASVGLLTCLLAAHVAGALWHRLVRRDGVLESIFVLCRAGSTGR